MIIVYAGALVFATLALILRRRLVGLASLRLRHVWLVWLALAIQVVIISVLPEDSHDVMAGFHLASYAVAAAFAVLNLRLAGAAPVFLGGAANLTAIALNGGTMPASRHALRVAQVHQRADHFANSALVAHPKLAFLGDVFAIPGSVPVLHSAFSAGDVLVVIGIGTVIWRNCPPLPADVIRIPDAPSPLIADEAADPSR